MLAACSSMKTFKDDHPQWHMFHGELRPLTLRKLHTAMVMRRWRGRRGGRRGDQRVSYSETRTFKGVNQQDVENFVTEKLGGQLKLAGTGRSGALSYHLPKQHGSVKLASGRFGRTWTRGSIMYYPKTGTMQIRTPAAKAKVNILEVWTKYQEALAQ